MRYLVLFLLLPLCSWGFSEKKPEPTRIMKKAYPSTFILEVQNNGNKFTVTGSSPVEHNQVHLVWHLPPTWKVLEGQQSEVMSLSSGETFTRSLKVEKAGDLQESLFVEVYVETKRGRFGSSATTRLPESQIKGVKSMGLAPEAENRNLRIIQ